MAVVVPSAMLLARDIPDSARLLWIVGQAVEGEPTPRLLQERSGLSRHTVLRGLAYLAAPGPETLAQGPRACFPNALILETRLGVKARLLYGILQLTPGFERPRGRFTYAELSALAGASPNTLHRAVAELCDYGWLETSRANKASPIEFGLRDPVAELQSLEVASARRRLERARFLGEALMREYLSLLVDSDEFEDNATPGFLVNPLTGEELQYDRYYPPRVAFEFQGPQHYGPTARYSNPQEARELQARDAIKLGLSCRRGVTLVEVRPKDLTLEGMKRKVAGLLPPRDLANHHPLIGYLESVSRAYLRKAT